MRNTARMRYTRDHQWLFRKGKTVLLGITDYGQQWLSDVINVELPEPDEHHHYEAGDDICVVESLKTAHDCRTPIAGHIVSINTHLLSNPESINADPYGEGWIVEMQPDDMSDIDELMSLDEYEALVPDEEEE